MPLLLYYRNTVAWILRHGSIVSASILAALLIVGAYFFASGSLAPRQVGAEGTAALMQAIATRDSNGDGLPDWEKVLYGIPIDATTTDYFHLGMTDGEAVARGLIVPKAVVNIPKQQTSSSTYADYGLPPPPAEGTLTGAFAKNIFLIYLNAEKANGGAPLSQAQQRLVAKQALSQLLRAIPPVTNFKSQKDLTVSTSSLDAFKTFANAAGMIFLKNKSTATTTAVEYLKESLATRDNTAMLAHMASLSKMYQDAAAGLAVLPVPKKLAAADLSLINSLANLGSITNDFTKVNTDPIATLVALERYPQTVQSFANALTSINILYAIAGVSLPTGSSGADFVNIIMNAQAPLKTQKTL